MGFFQPLDDRGRRQDEKTEGYQADLKYVEHTETPEYISAQIAAVRDARMSADLIRPPARQNRPVFGKPSLGVVIGVSISLAVRGISMLPDNDHSKTVDKIVADLSRSSHPSALAPRVALPPEEQYTYGQIPNPRTIHVAAPMEVQISRTLVAAPPKRTCTVYPDGLLIERGTYESKVFAGYQPAPGSTHGGNECQENWYFWVPESVFPPR